MKLPPQLSRGLAINWLGWRRPEARDAVVLFGTAVLAYVVAHTYDLAPKLFQLGIDYAEWEIDDIIFVVFVMSIAMMIYAFRRYRDLSKEIKSRIGAEIEARKLARHDPLTGLPNAVSTRSEGFQNPLFDGIIRSCSVPAKHQKFYAYAVELVLVS